MNTTALPSALNYVEVCESGAYSCIMEVSDKLQAPAALTQVPTGQNAWWAEGSLSGQDRELTFVTNRRSG